MLAFLALLLKGEWGCQHGPDAELSPRGAAALVLEALPFTARGETRDLLDGVEHLRMNGCVK